MIHTVQHFTGTKIISMRSRENLRFFIVVLWQLCPPLSASLSWSHFFITVFYILTGSVGCGKLQLISLGNLKILQTEKSGNLPKKLGKSQAIFFAWNSF